MSEKIGNSVLLYVWTGAAYEAVAAQDNVDLSESRGTIDVSGKQDNQIRQIEYGQYSASLTLSSAYVSTDAGALALRTALRDGSTIMVEERLDGSAVARATALVTGFSRSHPMDARAAYSITMEITGEWTAV